MWLLIEIRVYDPQLQLLSAVIQDFISKRHFHKNVCLTIFFHMLHCWPMYLFGGLCYCSFCEGYLKIKKNGGGWAERRNKKSCSSSKQQNTKPKNILMLMLSILFNNDNDHHAEGHMKAGVSFEWKFKNFNLKIMLSFHKFSKAPLLLWICFPVEKLSWNLKCITRWEDKVGVTITLFFRIQVLRIKPAPY